MIGNLEVIGKRASSDPALARAINNATLAADRAAALTQQLLAFARKQPLQPGFINANEIASRSVDLIKSTLGEHIKVELELAPEKAIVHADPVQLENALLNLAVNARDAMPEGGQVTVRTRVEQDVTSETGTVVVEVSDTGTGMSADVRKRATEPFYTHKAGRSWDWARPQPSPWVCGPIQGLARNQQHARPWHDRANSFTAGFSNARAGVSRMLETVLGRSMMLSIPLGPALTPTVLVVEDDPLVRELIVMEIDEAGYGVLEADTAEEGLRLLESKAPSLLFTDIRLPGRLNGWQLAEEARQLIPNLPVMYATGYTDEAPRLVPGAVFIRKPYRPSEIPCSYRTAAWTTQSLGHGFTTRSGTRRMDRAEQDRRLARERGASHQAVTLPR